MLTPRGWWFMAITVTLLISCLWTGANALALTTLTLIVWFLGSWFVFMVQVQFQMRRMAIHRELRDDRGKVEALWAGRNFDIHLTLSSGSLVPAPYALIHDRLPLASRHISGNNQTEGCLSSQNPLEISYSVHCFAAGSLRFEGIQVQYTDLQGFFYHHTFVRKVELFPILPGLSDAKGLIPSVKRFNLLPLLGPHRHRRPGSGSELLDLRDYIPGDPPKTIAWKVSARRDRLITKEFESEVPIRCTLFVDTSESVRVGTVGDNALARLVTLAAGLSQAIAGSRDLPGLCLFDAEGVRRYIKPARGPRHVIQILHQLGEVANLMPATKHVEVQEILPVLYSFASEVYEDMLRLEVNSFPWWLPWWAPQSAATLRRPWRRGKTWLSKPFIWTWEFLRYLGAEVKQASLRLSPTAHRHYYWRKQISALLAQHFRMRPDALAQLLEDDEAFVKDGQRFLAEHQVPYSLSYYGPRGEYLFLAPGKVNVLASFLLQTLSRAKDNELYVLMVDLLEMRDFLEPLLRSVKVALARHHQVVVICPWPPGVPLPSSGIPMERLDKMPFTIPESRKIRGLLEKISEHNFHQAYYSLRRTFARLGVPVLCAAEDDSLRLILDRLKQLRLLEQGLR